ncbi:MAG: hypothetical protein COX61_02420 [Candidatus Brennerbacteria bacterium CG_4_10_14_0_2_um_filter_43_14]|nr:MAG: hypothetical protein COX61_02420 [Candidatus Brennerbacteria bacterium CG_4_10_14_0_2_um_filter_43_14]
MEHYSSEQQKIIKHFHNLKSIGVDFAYLKNLRAEILTRVAVEQPRHAVIVWQTAWRVAMRAVIAVACLGIVGFGVVFASQYANPQSFLYPIKLASEQAQLILGGTQDGAKADLRAKFAQIRLSEIQTLDQENQLETSSVQKALAQYAQHLQDAQADLESVSSSNDVHVLDQLLALENRMFDLTAQLSSVYDIIQTKLQDQTILDQAASARHISALTQQVIVRTIIEFEANSQVVAADARKGDHILTIVFLLQQQYDSVWSEFSDKVKQDTRAEMQMLSDINATVSPEKGAADIPSQDWDAYVALRDIKQSIARMAAMKQEERQVMSDDQYMDVVREYKRMSGILAQLELSLRTH